ncbi:PEP-CTERM sorting domain-containing protein [Phycisphaera mikurensis]|uniref:Ice-binding protein C-terminal domain-containing protein n=1 Tax=Phycisphaera mikurensis (strain NBRC 102666 / KCTC 22515 / FYK2301M01) TaxID=1142394 RepID=I0IBY5_PHYMF|nr:PEP-CTERM sorting domain-containing protein [Phycisphaera mikurensis]MBB6442003.1 hypothetical protein [Phycisphaera mikurensis]BAM02773.1 hypothetical protein PSMK_06140 [Phycisphaera mikurensis NBRC 102666]
MKISTTPLAAGLVASLVAPSALAVTFDFTAAEGFSDGALAGQNGFASQAGYQVDSTGTGVVSGVTNGFERFLVGEDAIVLDATTDSVALGITGFSMNRPAADAPGGTFGLSNDFNIASSGTDIGIQLRYNANGDLLLDEVGFGDSGSSIDTGFNLGDVFDIDLNVVVSGTDAVTTATIGSATASYTKAIGADTSFALIYQSQGPSAGTATFDSVSYTVTPVPEPASAALVGLGALALLGRRRG